MKANRVEWIFLIGCMVITILAWFGYAVTANTVNVGEQFFMVACAVVGSSFFFTKFLTTVRKQYIM